MRDSDRANSKKFIRKLDEKKIGCLEKQAHEMIKPDDEHEKPIVINFESIKGIESGKVQLDLDKISKNQPVVFELEEGKYIIDLANFSGTEKKSAKGKKSKILKSKKGLLHGEFKNE